MSISSGINHKYIDQSPHRRGFFSISGKVLESCHRIESNEPVLPRKRQCPIKYFLGEALSEFHDNVKYYYL